MHKVTALTSRGAVVVIGMLAIASLMLCAASAASGTADVTAAQGRCRSLRLTGSTVTQARSRARRSGCRLQLRGAQLRDATVQTIRRQRSSTQPGVITVWINPLCWRSAAPGPPPGEPIITPGRTGLTAGLFIAGGPAVSFSNPRCVSPAGTPSPGTITVTSAAAGQTVASKTLGPGQLAWFALPPGHYTLSGRFGNATSNGIPYTETAGLVTVTAHHTTRQDLVAAVP